MLHLVHKPSLPLSRFVESFWLACCDHETFGREKILPDGAVELSAAMTFAKRRRFGPFARPRDENEAERKVRREKALGAFSRAGFPFPLAKLILDSDSMEELEALVEEASDQSP